MYDKEAQWTQADEDFDRTVAPNPSSTNIQHSQAQTNPSPATQSP